MNWRVIGVALAAWLMATAAQATAGYNVCYHKTHLLYRMGDAMNVIDVDVEWPEYVDGSTLKPLQERLTRFLFRSQNSDWRSAYAAWLRQFGEPVTGPLEKIPDDDAFCYVSCRLQVMGRIPDRLLSVNAQYTCTPGKRSAVKGDTLSTMLTYILPTGRIVEGEDVLDTRLLQPERGNEAAVEALLRGAGDAVPSQTIGLQLEAACMGDGWVMADMLCLTPDGVEPVRTVVSYDAVRHVVAREVRRAVDRKLEERVPDPFESPSMCEGDTICRKADTTPSFAFGSMTLGQYVSDRLRMPGGWTQLPDGQVVVSMVIDRKGEVKDVRVVGPLHPALDREAARVVRLMPRWKPGTQNGQPVCVRCRLPISFKGT